VFYTIDRWWQQPSPEGMQAAAWRARQQEGTKQLLQLVRMQVRALLSSWKGLWQALQQPLKCCSQACSSRNNLMCIAAAVA
jgi:hypothetical protein